MAHVMICRGNAAGLRCDGIDRFLWYCVHDTGNGRGEVGWTDDLRRAKRFVDQDETLEFWRRQSETVPLRDDGEPNRPLTAFDIEIVPLPAQATIGGIMIACEPCTHENGWETMTDFGSVKARCDECGSGDRVAVVTITKALLAGGSIG